MANTTPIDTQTILRRFDLTQADVQDQIKNQCDNLGGGGYELRAAFRDKVENKENLFLIFQLTR